MTSPGDDAGRSGARLKVLTTLKRSGYRFVTPTPATHRRRLRGLGPEATAGDLRDVFGWNLPFEAKLLGLDLYELAWSAGAIAPHGNLLRATLRVASLGSDLFFHSPFPASDEAVFFGPDSYRFARFIGERLQDAKTGGSLLDIGTGSGVGAVVAGHCLRAARVVATDINPAALTLARVNLAAAGLGDAHVVEADGLAAIEGDFDAIIANPPFMANAKGKLYCHGGGERGAQLSIDWALQAAQRLRPGGRLLLYTGSAIVAGRDGVKEALHQRLPPGVTLEYAELDPDIFGEVLGADAYREVERIAAVGAEIRLNAS